MAYQPDKLFTRDEGIVPISDDSMYLLKAARVIETLGHTKHELCNDLTGAVCLRGAINIALTGKPLAFEKLNDARRLFCRVSDYLGQCEVDWNNAPERTASEVIHALREAAAQ